MRLEHSRYSLSAIESSRVRSYIQYMREKSTIGRLIAWFKIRFIFTTEQLEDAIYMIDRVDRDRLNDEKLWEQAQLAREYLLKELTRRGK